MTEMIAAEPALAERLLSRLLESGSAMARLAEAVRETAASGAPIVLTGCGTSEHAAQGVADILREALRRAGLAGRVTALQAFEASLDPQGDGLLIGISHEGGTAATNRALEAARDAGARVAIITATERSPGGQLAELVVATEEMDQSWCHTVGYLSPLVAGAALSAFLTGDRVQPSVMRQLVAAGADATRAADEIAAVVGRAPILLVVGSGSDRPAARELALKIEEGAHQPSAMRDLETFLHGHLAATDADTALVLILADRDHHVQRVVRARQLLAAANVVGIRIAGIFTASVDTLLEPRLTPAGRIVVPDADKLPGPIAALLSTATALQLLTERIARARGTNPDAIRRDDPRYREAAEVAEHAE